MGADVIHYGSTGTNNFQNERMTYETDIAVLLKVRDEERFAKRRGVLKRQKAAEKL